MEIYMKTYTGLRVDPINPTKDMICLEDIAHALSLNCRGNGQVPHFYSVAQHCINCEKEAEERMCSDRVKLGCLLHDAAEAYITDFIRPVKQLMPEYIRIEKRLLEVIFEKFGLSDVSDAEWKIIKSIDDDLLVYDMTHLLGEPKPKDGYGWKRKPETDFVLPQNIEKEYIDIAQRLVQHSANNGTK